MWFIKTDFWNEFQDSISSYQKETDIIKKIHTIKAAENFCKQGKGVSFYNRRVINNKLLKEIEKYKNDKNYYEYSIKEI